MAKKESVKGIKAKSQWQANVKAKLLQNEQMARETTLEQMRLRAQKARETFLSNAQKRAEGRERQLNALGEGRATQSLESPMPSSWVDQLGYDPSTLTLTAVLSGKQYYWRPVPESVYLLWEKGLNSCKTNDPTGQKRWYRGKNPSLGATWWKTIMRNLAGKRVMK